MLYMVTFTINIPPMLVYIPYMDPMGYKSPEFGGNHLACMVFFWAFLLETLHIAPPWHPGLSRRDCGELKGPLTRSDSSNECLLD